MKEIQTDFWSVYTDYDAIVCPTNGVVKKSGELVMGGGLAKQFRDMFPYIAGIWGYHVATAGNTMCAYEHPGHPVLVSFPSKNHWRESSDISLIEQSAAQLKAEADSKQWKAILVPQVGCGLGGLTWSQVKPILKKYLDSRFTIISKK